MPAGNYKSNAGTIPGRNDITIKIQSQQPNNQWATYDVHYIPMVSGSQGFGATDNATCWTQFTDPRTARFSAHGRIGWPPPPLCPGNASMTDPPIVFESPRTGADVGLGANFGMPGLQGAIPNPNSIGWFGGPWSSGGNNLFRAGLYSQNDANLLNHPPNIGPYCYADADGVVRRAMGAYVDPSLFLTNNSTGLPIATASTFSNNGVSTPTAQSQSRPFILNRPFRTVTELGYVFSGTPWKNLDFIFPESGDAALLDLFCIREDMTSNAVVAGKVNLNTRNRPVLQSILMQAYKDELSPTGPGQVGASEAGNMTAKLTSRTQSAPLRWLSELVGRFDPSSKTYDGFSADLTTGAFTGTDTNSPRIARFRESALRALVDVGTTRTWTFMIDLIAQTGRYPQSAVHATTPLAAFLVEGEKRYWIHVSIDRMTGQVIDKQIETVSE